MLTAGGADPSDVVSDLNNISEEFWFSLLQYEPVQEASRAVDASVVYVTVIDGQRNLQDRAAIARWDETVENDHQQAS